MKAWLTGRLIRRYKRFLADVRLDDGSVITVHCPNTGSMKNCTEQDAEVWLSTSENPNRKYPHTWELIRTHRGHYIGINTHRANELVETAIRSGRITPLTGYAGLAREVRYGTQNSRIDLLLTDESKADCFVEVKSVTLLEEPASRGVGYFPDAVSERGSKHLEELQAAVAAGHRAVLFFCVQHTGINEVRPADHIDERYGRLLREAKAAGVELLAYKVRKTPHGLALSRPLDVNLP